jgi:hypothetical protein
VFVNYRAAADITYMPPDIYERVMLDSRKIDGIHYASVNFLRMNMYLELSRPAGMVSRWEKVYERLLLLNEEHPLKAGRCGSDPLEALEKETGPTQSAAIVQKGMDAGAVFLNPNTSPRVVLMMSDKAATLVETLVKTLHLKPTKYEAMGELLPARTELRQKRALVAVVFETVACHSYTTLEEPKGYRLGSLDLLIQMYYAIYFADLKGYIPVKILCVIQKLIDREAARRLAAAEGKGDAHDVFPLTCVGHQPSMPELKKSHRMRVKEKRKELMKALRMQESVTFRRRSRRKKSA